MKDTSFFTIIPATIRHDNNLTLLQKMLLGDLIGLADKDGYCAVSNSYLAKLFDRNPRYISEQLRELERGGYIKMDNKNGRRRKILLICLVNMRAGDGDNSQAVGAPEENPNIQKNLKVIPEENPNIQKNLKVQKTDTLYLLNNININNKLVNVLDKSKTLTNWSENAPTEFVKEQKVRENKSNLYVNFILTCFKDHRGYPPVDRRPRQRAYNIYQRLNKTYGASDTPLTEIIREFFSWLSRQKEWDAIQTLDACRRRVEVFIAYKEKMAEAERRNREALKKLSEREEVTTQLDEDARREKMNKIREMLDKVGRRD